MVDKIVRGGITLLLCGALVVMWVMEKEAPMELMGLAGIAIGQFLPTPGSIKKGS